nr:uncharacterized protein LOC113805331 [Penaeus vannamei]
MCLFAQPSERVEGVKGQGSGFKGNGLGIWLQGSRVRGLASGVKGQGSGFKGNGGQGQGLASGVKGQRVRLQRVMVRDLASGVKGQGLASGVKGQGLASGVKGQGLASGVKGQGFGFRGQGVTLTPSQRPMRSRSRAQSNLHCFALCNISIAKVSA